MHPVRRGTPAGCRSTISRPWRAHRLHGRSGYCLEREWPRTGEDAFRSLDRGFIDSRRTFMANRGVWDAVWSAGPCVSFAHAAPHVDRYLEVLDEYLREVVVAK